MAIIKYSIFLFFSISFIWGYILIPKKLVLLDSSELSQEVNNKISEKLLLLKYYSNLYWNSKDIFNYLKLEFPELDSLHLKYVDCKGIISLSSQKPLVKIGNHILTEKGSLIEKDHYNLDELGLIQDICLIEGESDTSNIASIINYEIIKILEKYKIFWVNDTHIILVPYEKNRNYILVDLTNLYLEKIHLAESIGYKKNKFFDIRFRDMIIVRPMNFIKKID